MKLSRPSRFVASLVTLFCLLFTQLAVASYACAGVGQAANAAVATASEPMPGCAEMRMDTGAGVDRSILCHAHCDPGQQSLDTQAAPQLPQFVSAGLTLVLPDLRLAAHTLVAHPKVLLLERATAPPLSIRNCCFRI